MRISDWSSDVCSSDLHVAHILFAPLRGDDDLVAVVALRIGALAFLLRDCVFPLCDCGKKAEDARAGEQDPKLCILEFRHHDTPPKLRRSEEHTSELQSLMRISYAVFCLKKKKQIR